MRVHYSTIVVFAALLCFGGLWLWPADRVVADSMSGGGVSSSGSQPWIGNHNNMPRQTLSPVGTVFTPPTSFGNYWILNNAASQTVACPPDIADGDSMNIHIQYGAGAPYSPAISFSVPCYGWTSGVQPSWSEAPTQSDSAFCQSMNPPDVSGVSFVCGPQLNVKPPAVATAPPFDPARNTTGNITLSNSNLKATETADSGIPNLVFSTVFHSSGVYVFETTMTTCVDTTACQVGLANSSESSPNFLGQTTNSFGITASNGQVFLNNVIMGTINSFAVGAVVDVKVDLTGKTVANRVNGGSFSSTVSIASLATFNLSPAVKVRNLTDAFTMDVSPSGIAGATPW